MKKIKYPDAEMMAMDLADILASELNDALHNKERVTLVVPGGTTPAPIFDILSGVHLDWARVNVMLSDERWVSENHARSNTRLLREHLLVDQAAAATLIPLYLENETPETALPQLSKAIGPLLPIDVLLLGMGQDMHTASLFPKADNLEDAFEPNAPLLLPMRSRTTPEVRVTLTAPVLHGAMKTHIVFTSKSKNKALKAAHKLKDPMLAPISGFLKGSTVHWAP
ncbi:6-phosphogluconolactonase [Profundibacter sp.]